MSTASLNLLCDLDNAVDDNNAISAYEQFFYSGRTILSLAILSTGLYNDVGSMLFDPNTVPWKMMNANITRPKADLLKVECIQRWRVFI
jgi:hypothetical protein